MKARIYVLGMMVTMSLSLFAQATDLVIDNQNPGWLSSKINYGDQLTVKDLKVTGYINDTDMKFIGTLMTRSLDGEIDLSECNIVGSTADKDNILGDFGLSEKKSIRVYRIPKSVTQANSCLYNLRCDTLYFDCKMTSIDQSMLWDKKLDIGHLHLGDNIESIPDEAFGRTTSVSTVTVKSVHFPTNLKSIGNNAFYDSELTSCNFNELVNLEFLGAITYNVKRNEGGYQTLGAYSPDTIIIPSKITTYELSAIKIRSGQHIFIGENTSVLSGGNNTKHKYDLLGTGVVFHINRLTPPTITNWATSYRPYWFEESTVYVPKGAKEAYMNSKWEKATIIEVNPAGIDDILVSGTTDSDIYSINGIKVHTNGQSNKDLPKGIYIINGKKVVVK